MGGAPDRTADAASILFDAQATRHRCSTRLNLWPGCLAVVSGRHLAVAFSQAGKFHTTVYRGLEFDKNNWSSECCIATEFEIYVFVAAT